MFSVSNYVQCFRLCSVFQIMFSISNYVQCFKLCSVFQIMFSVSNHVQCFKLCSVFQIRVDKRIFAATVILILIKWNQKLCFSVVTQQYVTTDSTQQSSFVWMRVAYIHYIDTCVTQTIECGTSHKYTNINSVKYHKHFTAVLYTIFAQKNSST